MLFGIILSASYRVGHILYNIIIKIRVFLNDSILIHSIILNRSVE